MTHTADAGPDSRIKVRRVIHTIHAVADLAACRASYMDVLGGLIFAEGYFEAEDRDMALMYVANHMIEPMAPRDATRLEKHFARYLHRYGPGFHSFEIKIDDALSVAASLKASGCKLSAEFPVFFYVRQESTGGVLLEVCQTAMPNDPYDRINWRADWAGMHPTTLLCLDHIACVTPDVAAAVHFFTGLLDGELLLDQRVSSPQPGRRVLLRLGDSQVAFIQPDESASGPLGTFLAPPTSGIYCLVWRVADAAKAEDFFHKKGLRTTREDCVAGGFAIDPRDFQNARHEFISHK
jgi:hypothetical protein